LGEIVSAQAQRLLIIRAIDDEASLALALGTISNYVITRAIKYILWIALVPVRDTLLHHSDRGTRAPRGDAEWNDSLLLQFFDPTPPSQTWRTFLRNHADAIVAIDLCVVPTLTFERLFAFLVVGHGRRQLLWFAVTRHPTAEWLAQQIVEAFPWGTAPTYLVRDNDGADGQAFTNRVRAMGIRDRPTSPRSPWQNAYVERLIGTLRRDCLDHVLIFGERHLRRILTLYSLYYNETRTHLGLGKDAPPPRSGIIMVTPILSGLHHRYARI
jgi:Integrase core domain